MNQSRVALVESCLTRSIADGLPITVKAVAQATGISRTALYRERPLIALIHEYRLKATEATTLTNIATDITHLRTSLEAIADRVRDHEARLRRLERRTTTSPKD